MVAWLRREERYRLLPRVKVVAVETLPLLAAEVPPGKLERRMAQVGRALGRRGVRRVLVSPELAGPEGISGLEAYGLQEVDPLPLCRAKGGELALACLEGVPCRERRVVLRGERADGTAWTLAEKLCPHVGLLLLDFQQGEEALSRHLRALYGAPVLRPEQAPPPQAAVELSPCRALPVRTLRLWGKPELAGLTLTGGEGAHPEIPRLPFLQLLWETGRVELKDLWVAGRAE